MFKNRQEIDSQPWIGDQRQQVTALFQRYEVMEARAVYWREQYMKASDHRDSLMFALADAERIVNRLAWWLTAVCGVGAGYGVWSWLA